MKITVEIDPADLIAAAKLFNIGIATPEPAQELTLHLSGPQVAALRDAYISIHPVMQTKADELKRAFPKAFPEEQGITG